MDWKKGIDGRMIAVAGGIDLIFDPIEGKMQIKVTDYHAQPVVVDAGELFAMAHTAWETPGQMPRSPLERFRLFARRRIRDVKLAGAGVIAGAAICYWLLKADRDGLTKRL